MMKIITCFLISVLSLVQSMASDTIYRNDATTCALEGYYRKASLKTNEKMTVVAYPNPAKESITFYFKSKDFTNAEIKIFNAIDGLIETHDVHTNKFDVDCLHYNNGVYMYQLFVEGKLAGKGKFTIIK